MSSEAEARCIERSINERSADIASRKANDDAWALSEFDRVNPQAAALRAQIAPEVARQLEHECALDIGQQLLALIAKAETEQRVHNALMGLTRKLELPQHLRSPERTPAIGTSWNNATAVEQFAVQIWRRITATKPGYQYTRSEADAVRNSEMPTGGEP